MDWKPLFVGGIIGFILGIFVPGVRTMLSSLIMPHKIRMGNISCAFRGRPSLYYYVEVSIEMSNLWNVIASNIGGVKASLQFENRDTGLRLRYLTYWSEVGEKDISITLRPEGEYLLLIANMLGDKLIPFGCTDLQDTLIGDLDLTITLWSGRIFLGGWHYTKAILQDKMQEVEPDNHFYKDPNP